MRFLRGETVVWHSLSVDIRYRRIIIRIVRDNLYYIIASCRFLETSKKYNRSVTIKLAKGIFQEIENLPLTSVYTILGDCIKRISHIREI